MHATPPLCAPFAAFVLLCLLKVLLDGGRATVVRSTMRWIAMDGTVWPTFYQKMMHDNTIRRRIP
jgi:hypothetical protein